MFIETCMASKLKEMDKEFQYHNLWDVPLIFINKCFIWNRDAAVQIWLIQETGSEDIQPDLLTNCKSSSIIGCKNKRLFAHNDARYNYKFDLETTPGGMPPVWVKEMEMYCGIEYSVEPGVTYIQKGKWMVNVSFKDGVNCYPNMTFLL